MPEGKLDSEKWSTFKAVVSRSRVVKHLFYIPCLLAERWRGKRVSHGPSSLILLMTTAFKRSKQTIENNCLMLKTLKDCRFLNFL